MPADTNDSPSGLASFARSAKPAMTKRLRELARENPGADIYEPCTLWDHEEKSERKHGVRVSGATSGDRQEVRLNIWRRAPGTPQAFARKLICEAHERIRDEQATDDAYLVEKLGVPVKVVRGQYRNIKITTEEDVSLALTLLGKEDKPEG